jgi:uncharacterized protein (DUF849 family)
VLIQVALNGGRRDAPSTIEAIVADVDRCFAAGASVFHVHARDRGGWESLEACEVDPLVAAIRRSTPEIALGVTTAAWILPDAAKRIEAIRKWTQLPDFASVNFDEERCEELARLLVNRGIGVEAGILDEASTARFLAAGIDVIRVLIEIQEQQLEDALRAIDTIVEALGDHPAPRLLHGHGAVTWQLIDEASRRGYQTRIGLEDVQCGPDGTKMTSNAELFRIAQSRVEKAPGARGSGLLCSAESL